MRSTRLPGKMLADIGGKPLVAWVAQRAAQSGADEVVVATDHQEIADAVAAHGWRVCTTSLALRPHASIATAVHPITTAQVFFDPNVVKVVIDTDGYAQYFSRAPIPYARDAFAQSRAHLPPELPALRHIGIYAYRVRFLREYASLSPTPAERFEALEQLRALGHGRRIAVAFWNEAMEPGVDTQEDLERVRRVLAGP